MRVLFVISDLGVHGAQKQVVELSRELDDGRELGVFGANRQQDRIQFPHVRHRGVQR